MSRAISYTLPEHLRARKAAQRQEHIVQIIAVVVAVVCFVGAGLLVGPINEMRKEYQLVIDPASVRGLPPDIALLGKLGTFRALAIDWASIRADRLKEQGKMYEALELHKTVCRLQPRFAQAWMNAAWNMAYNISVCQFTPEARWRWVNNGIKILRDEALVYNPRSVGIYKELAWIYWHKMGDFLDDEHRTYRRVLAVEMEAVLGPAPIIMTDQERLDWFKKIVDAPRDLGRFIRDDAGVAALVSKLENVSLGADEQMLEFYARHIRPELPRADLIAASTDEPDRDALAIRILRDPEEAEALDRLLAAVRSEVLRNKMKFDVDWMYDLMVNQYGPLDWRSVFAHSLYWSSKGNEVAKGRIATHTADSMNLARLILYSLHGLVTRGNVICTPNFDDPYSSYVEETIDVRYIPYSHDAWHRLAKEQWENDPKWNPDLGIKGTGYFNGFVSHMHNWIELLYYEGGDKNRRLAEEYYTWLRENNTDLDGNVQEMYTVGLEQFVMGAILDQLKTYKQAVAILRSFIRRSLKELALGLSERSLQSMKRAGYCYEYWMADTNIDINERRTLQPIRILRRDVIAMFFVDVTIDPLAKARLWRALELDARQLTYDRLGPYFDRLCDVQNPPWDVSIAFPPPAGMEEFRKREPEYRGAPRSDEVEQGKRYKG